MVKVSPGLALLILFCAGLPAPARVADHASLRTIPMSIRAYRFENETWLQAEIRNPYRRALCISADRIPGWYEITEGPTAIFGETGAEVERRVREDRLAVYPKDMDGRIVLVIPPGRLWFHDYSLTSIFDLKDGRKYIAAVHTHGLFCEIYQKGTPEEMMENWDEFEKYKVSIISNKAEFQTGKPGAG